MLLHLGEVSIRALVLAAIAAAVLWRRRSAAFQHAVWASVAMGMLALFLFGRALPRLALPLLPARAAAAIEAPASVAPRVFPAPAPGTTTRPLPAMPRETAPAMDWGEIALTVYAAVALLMLARLVMGMALAWRLVASSRAVGGFSESASIGIPLTVGGLRPVILLPLEWRAWDRSKIEAVLGHEGEHVRRRDGLIAMLAGLNRCLFWFHPLAWWMERRLALLAELACDEACVAARGDRQGYANLLLEMARAVDGSGGRMRAPVFSMAAHSHLRERIDSILDASRPLRRGLSRACVAELALCTVPLVWGAGAIGLGHRAGQIRWKQQLILESIKPTQQPPLPGQATCASSTHFDPGVDVYCISLRQMVQQALQIPASRLATPDWAAAQQFDISAALPGSATEADLYRSEDQFPELYRSLLEDRFGLKFHTEVRDGPVMALVVADGGPRFNRAGSGEPEWVNAAAKARYRDRMVFGVAFRSAAGPDQDTAFYESPEMGRVRTSQVLVQDGEIAQDSLERYEAPSITMQGLAELATIADGGIDSVVADATGLKGRYQLNLDLSMVFLAKRMDAVFHGIAPPQSPQLGMVEDAIRKLGLELRPARAPLETIVVDRLERTPKGN